METRQMRQFVAIAEEGSLSAAAARLGVAQPSLSQLVKTLEAQIGVDLLVRSPRGVTLTAAGRVLLRHAREILSATDRAIEAVRLSGTEAIGQVSFGFPSSVSMVLSVPLAETVRLSLPRVSLKPVEAMSGFIRNWLMDGSIDLGVLYDIGPVRHCEAQLLLTEDLHFFAAPDAWPLKTEPGEEARLSAVAAEELVLPSRKHGLREMIDRFSREHCVRLNVVHEMDGLAQIKSMVARGSGCTILAPAAAHDYVTCGQMVSAPIVDPVLRRPVHLVRNPEHPLTPAVEEVRKMTISVIEDLVRREIWTGVLPKRPR